jgi:hypothetical protein
MSPRFAGEHTRSKTPSRTSARSRFMPLPDPRARRFRPMTRHSCASFSHCRCAVSAPTVKRSGGASMTSIVDSPTEPVAPRMAIRRGFIGGKASAAAPPPASLRAARRFDLHGHRAPEEGAAILHTAWRFSKRLAQDRRRQRARPARPASPIQ